MANETHISWCDRTWSPWTGCTKISPACDGCYAAHLMDTRMHRVEWGEPGAGEGTRDRMSAPYWTKPRSWNRLAQATGTRPTIFPSLCDPFDLAVPMGWHAQFHEVILSTPHLHWLLLTKRVGNVRKVMEYGHDRLSFASNWSLGATFANQTEWDRDYWKLRDTAADFGVTSFGSFEPLLSPIEFYDIWFPDWVIVGGETDQGAHKARPISATWVRSIRDQCAKAGVPFHFKQWGEYAPYLPVTATGPSSIEIMGRVGKKAAGRLLDGRTHDSLPAKTGGR